MSTFEVVVGSKHILVPTEDGGTCHLLGAKKEDTSDGTTAIVSVVIPQTSWTSMGKMDK